MKISEGFMRILTFVFLIVLLSAQANASDNTTIQTTNNENSGTLELPKSWSEKVTRTSVNRITDKIILPNGLSFHLPKEIPIEDNLITDLNRMVDANNSNAENISSKSNYFKASINVGLKPLLSVSINPMPLSERKIGQEIVKNAADEQLAIVEQNFHNNFKELAKVGEQDLIKFIFSRITVKEKVYFNINLIWERTTDKRPYRVLENLFYFYDYQNSMVINVSGLVGLSDEILKTSDELLKSLYIPE